MNSINQFIFSLSCYDDTNLFDYWIKGALISLFKQISTNLSSNLYNTPDKKYRTYTIYHDIEPINSQCNIVNFIFNVFDKSIADSVSDYLFSQNLICLNINNKKYNIEKIVINSINILDFIKKSVSLNKFELSFLSPTAFKERNGNLNCVQPLPKKIFGFLIKIWNNLITEPEFHCPNDLYFWIENNVLIQKSNIKYKYWFIDNRNTLYKGFIGNATYIVKERQDEFSKWIDILLNFGMYTSLGINRTIGFGHYIVNNLD